MDFGEAVGQTRSQGLGEEPHAFSGQSRDREGILRCGLAAGGKDNGGPGLRPQYHPNYYGAFVYDCDGNNIEAVCHQPE